jgi:ApbE superfamily uncharacterized protein (UPF0280 family)
MERIYRNSFEGDNLVYFNVCNLQTDLKIGSNLNLKKLAEETVGKYRSQIEKYISFHPEFCDSLIPIEATIDAPQIIKRMCESSQKANVGPMASVAGAISEMLGKKILEYSDEVIVENGGDIFMKSNTIRKVGIYESSGLFSGSLGIEVDSIDDSIGICTSSGTLGHSLSFGQSDAVTIISKDTFLADSVATATGNRVLSSEDINDALRYAMSINEIEGALIVINGKMGVCGNVKLCKINCNFDKS